MKILIVDDEIFVRIGIKTTFDWSQHGYEIAGEAEDGLEAVEMFNRYKPDIVLVDIFMPRMNGIDFIKEVKDKNPFCKFIVLSCHNEFEYVREAMKLGVRDYIIKTTVKREELLEIVNRVAEEIKSDRSRLDALNAEKHENFINKPIIIKDYINAVIDRLEDDEKRIGTKLAELELGLSVPDMYMLLISIDNSARIKKLYEPRHYDLAIFGITNIAQEIAKRYAHAVTVKRNDCEIIVLASFEDSVRKDEIPSILDTISGDILKAVKEFLNLDISVGISRAMEKFSDISTAYNETSVLLGCRFFKGSSSIISCFDMEDNGEYFSEALSCLEKDLTDAVRQFDFEKIESILLEAKNSNILKQGRDPHHIKNVFLNFILTIIKTVQEEMPGWENKSKLAFNHSDILNSQYFEDLIDMVCSFIRDVVGIIDEKYNSKNKMIISKVMDYVHHNAGSEITLNDAAVYVSLSPGYFSRLFKKLAGENFIDFVIKVKMEKAKGLIRNGEKLWSISQQLGYTEVSSFSRIFKRISGMSPQQYRMKFIEPDSSDIK